MKKLITEKTIAQLKNDGIEFFTIDDDTLITPSAKDAARNEGIKLIRVEGKPCNIAEPVTDKAEGCKVKATIKDIVQGVCETNNNCSHDEVVTAVIKVLKDKNILDDILG